MKLFRKISCATILFVSLCSISLQGQGHLIVDKIIANVGQEFILYSEVQELYEYAKQQQQGYEAALQCDIIEQLLSSKLLLNQARLDSIEVSPIEVEAEVDRRIDHILSQMNGDEEFFQEFYGKTPQESNEDMREPVREQLTIQKIQGQLIDEVQITPNEVVAFFKSIPKDSLPFLNAEVELAEIVYKPKVNSHERQKALDQVNDIVERLKNGEDFAELASVYSDDPGSAKIGGDLDWQKRGTFVPEFEAEAFNLENDEISEIVETQFGFHIIQLIDRRGNSIHTRHILLKPEITEEDLTKAKNELDSIRSLILNDSLDFGIAVKLHSDENQFSYNNAGRLRNPKTGDTFFETSELPHQIYFAIEDLNENDVSEPIEFKERDETIYKIIRVQSKTRPHQANISEDYNKILQYAKESKKNEYFNTWMQDKLENTFITIKPDFSGCPNLEKYEDLK